MNDKIKNIEEILGLFELIRTMLLTGLSQTQIKQFLKDYTHTEIRKGKYENGRYIVKDLIYHD